MYSADPQNPDAKFYSNLTYDEILDKKLGVMDLTAICLCQGIDAVTVLKCQNQAHY